MEFSVWETDRRMKTERIASIILWSVSLFNAIVCTLLYHWFNSNVTILKTVLPQLLDVVLSLSPYVFYWVAFAFLMHCAARYSLASCKKLYTTYAVCLAAGYLIGYIIGVIMLKEPPVWGDLFQFLFEALIDALQLFAAVFIINRFVNRKNAKDDFRLSMTAKFFAFTDRFHFCAFLLAAVPAAVKLTTRIRYDLFFGFPQNLGDLLGMAFWYVLDLSCVVVGYFVIYWILTQLAIKDVEAEIAVDVKE